MQNALYFAVQTACKPHALRPQERGKCVVGIPSKVYKVQVFLPRTAYATNALLRAHESMIFEFYSFFLLPERDKAVNSYILHHVRSKRGPDR